MSQATQVAADALTAGTAARAAPRYLDEPRSHAATQKSHVVTPIVIDDARWGELSFVEFARFRYAVEARRFGERILVEADDLAAAQRKVDGWLASLLRAAG